jgi:hypothetical protein
MDFLFYLILTRRINSFLILSIFIPWHKTPLIPPPTLKMGHKSNLFPGIKVFYAGVVFEALWYLNDCLKIEFFESSRLFRAMVTKTNGRIFLNML